MAQLTVEGIYEHGKVELREKPKDVQRAHVTVTFHSQESTEDLREDLRQRFLARLDLGVDLGDGPLPSREELYAGRLKKF